MQKQHLNQAIAGITAVSLLVAQVPTAALAEALDEQGQAPVEQTQATEAAESPAADGTQQESSGQGTATQKDAPAQKDTEKSDDGTDEAADTDTPEAPADGEPAAPTQVVTSTTDKVADGQAADDESLVLDPADMLAHLVEDLEAGVEAGVIARRFHEGFSSSVARVAVGVARASGLAKAALGGGVFCNRIVRRQVTGALQQAGLKILQPTSLPINDGGISYGQAAVARARLYAALQANP